MDENQKKFLEELQDLLIKYNVNVVSAEHPDRIAHVPIRFWSNGRYLQIDGFREGMFEGCRTYYGKYHKTKGGNS